MAQPGPGALETAEGEREEQPALEVARREADAPPVREAQPPRVALEHELFARHGSERDARGGRRRGRARSAQRATGDPMRDARVDAGRGAERVEAIQRSLPRRVRGAHVPVLGGAVRDGGSFEERMGKVACWNSVMDEDRYMVRRWNEFIAA